MENKNQTGLCKYRFSNDKMCNEPLYYRLGYCFWHDPEANKNIPDVKERLEKRHKDKLPLEGFQLQKADLDDIYLIKADLRNVNLKRANLTKAHLFKADMENANLFKASLDKANLKQVNLKNAELLGSTLGTAELEGVNWGESFKLKNEKEAEEAEKNGNLQLRNDKYKEAEEIYRNIKTNFKNRGISYEGGKYFYREMVMKRKQIHKFSFEYFWFVLADITTGYGEKPYKIFSFSIYYIFLFSILFWLLGIQHNSGYLCKAGWGNSIIDNIKAFCDSFYFSVVTFVTLGYGDYTPVGIGKLFAIIEGFSGPFLISLFVITVYKRFMER